MRVAPVLPLGAVLALGALQLAGGAGARTAAPFAARTRSTHLQVIQVEYRLLLSRGVVSAGPVSLEAIDRGMDPHDVRLHRAGSARPIRTPELSPGERWDGVVNLKPGVYTLWCSLPEHAQRGMHATLRVVR